MKYFLFLLICVFYAQDCYGLVIPLPLNESSLVIMDLSANSTELYDVDVNATGVTEADALPTKKPVVVTAITDTSTDMVNVENRSEIMIPQNLSPKLQEKIASLSCDIPLLPSDSQVWIGNETHELLLPITIYPECPSPLIGLHSKSAPKCPPPIIKWEGEIEIECGDILLVKIDDVELIRRAKTSKITAVGRKALRFAQQPTIAVYQVTRTGHQNCDISEGVLLDINPLKINNRRVVTLYDKDLTEGINLLIVVSKLWKDQCVRLKVVVKSDNCGTNADCSGHGVCYTNDAMEGYECQCCPGFVGPHCEERDACYPSPCLNNGICVDLSQGQDGNKFQCLCPYGYSGLICGYEYNECLSSPCLNGGTCTDRIGAYTCSCGRGFAGKRCHIKVDLCEPNPCLTPRLCLDTGNNYSCSCVKGYTGERCDVVDRSNCKVNPCSNGGTCWTSLGSFYCACPPGYTGETCEVETIHANGKEGDMDVPITIHLDHLHNIYIALGTLACAFVIVAFILAVCHCKVNKTYKRFMWRSSFLSFRTRTAPVPASSSNREWFSAKNKAPMATPSRSVPALDSTEMYYAMDFGESQDSPLIQ